MVSLWYVGWSDDECSSPVVQMEGPTASLDDASAGVAPRTMQALFAEAKERAAQFDASIAMSVLEIYNEQVHDLLAPQSTKLELRQTSVGSHFQYTFSLCLCVC